MSAIVECVEQPEDEDASSLRERPRRAKVCAGVKLLVAKPMFARSFSLVRSLAAGEIRAARLALASKMQRVVAVYKEEVQRRGMLGHVLLGRKCLHGHVLLWAHDDDDDGDALRSRF